MKTSWGKPVHVIPFIRTLLIVLAVAACLATLMGCGTLLRQAAEQGDAKAQNNLGVKYDLGEGVAEDDAEAFKWYRKAAEQGHAKAQSNLGLMYDNGDGVQQDYVYAHMWFNIAAANGNTKAAKNRDIAAGELSSSGVEEAQKRAKRCMASGYKDCD